MSRGSYSRLLMLVALVVAVIPSAGSRVSLNSDGVTVIDGRKVFPIGFTMPPPPDGRTPDGKSAIQELHDAGATFLRTGPMAEGWSEAGFAREQAWMDAAARNGMHCLVNLREAAAVRNAKDEALLRRIVTQFRGHPGLGGWKGVDEPEWGKQPIPPMLRARDIVRELDPNHPIEITQAPRGTADSLRRYNPCCDILCLDIYPISYPPGVHTLLPNKEISMVGDWTRFIREVGENRAPTWMTLQIAFSGVVKPGKTLRMPTPSEERFMTYQAIINGARGLLYFGGHLKQAMTPADAELGRNWRFWNRSLRPVIEEIGEKSPLAPALVAPESKLPIHAAGEGIELCARQVGDDLYILACKREGKTIRAELSGVPAGCAEGEVMFEEPRKVLAKDGRFTDWFAPFDVHVYRFPIHHALR